MMMPQEVLALIHRAETVCLVDDNPRSCYPIRNSNSLPGPSDADPPTVGNRGSAAATNHRDRWSSCQSPPRSWILHFITQFDATSKQKNANMDDKGQTGEDASLTAQPPKFPVRVVSSRVLEYCPSPVRDISKHRHPIAKTATVSSRNGAPDVYSELVHQESISFDKVVADAGKSLQVRAGNASIQCGETYEDKTSVKPMSLLEAASLSVVSKRKPLIDDDEDDDEDDHEATRKKMASALQPPRLPARKVSRSLEFTATPVRDLSSNLT